MPQTSRELASRLDFECHPNRQDCRNRDNSHVDVNSGAVEFTIAATLDGDAGLRTVFYNYGVDKSAPVVRYKTD